MTRCCICDAGEPSISNISENSETVKVKWTTTYGPVCQDCYNEITLCLYEFDSEEKPNGNEGGEKEVG